MIALGTQIKAAALNLLDLFWPPYCAICGLRTESASVCGNCIGELKVEGYRVCPECEERLENDALCPKHGEATYPFYVPAFKFGECVRDLIHLLKYSGRRDIGEFFGNEIVNRLSGNGLFSNADALIPVPLHKVRKRERGYNQSEIVANRISKSTGLPVLADTVKRIRKTKSQTKLNQDDRKTNVAGAFKTAEKLIGKRVIIVDDVITTGATTREVASAIKSAGGEVVCALCIAHPDISESKENNL